MKKKGKIVIIILLIILIFVIFTFIGAYMMFREEIAAIKSIEKIEDRTYHMTYRGSNGFDDFLKQGGASDDGEVAAYLTSYLSKGFYKSSVETADGGCSVISDIRKTGRNFDWSDAPVMVMSTYPDDGYASVSTCNLAFLGFGEGFSPDDGFMSGLLSIAAIYVPLDGMNEKGLTVADLVIDTPERINQDEGRTDLTITTLIRLLLDRAATVDEAIALISEYDIHSSAGMMHHLAISDASGRSVAVEFYGDDVYVTETPVVTNFYLSKECPLYLTGSEESHLRYDLLQDYIGNDDYSSALECVRQGNMEDGFDITLWSVIFDREKLTCTYHFREDFAKSRCVSVL
ncbi:MAG: linear amide C-N hydrolase [Bullifex sp.]